MLSGFNTNVRHRGLLLHVQTEDSGRAHPHIITHLYHGGTILASERCQYGDRLGSADLVREVRALMEAQHRAMLQRLRDGELDLRLVERLGRDALAEDATGSTVSGATGSTASGSSGSTESGVTGAHTGPASAEAPGPGDAVGAAAPAGAAAPEPAQSLDEIVLEYLLERFRRRGSEAR